MSAAVTVRVLYSCEGCGLTDVAVAVPARAGENVVQWMEATVRLLSADHRGRSPACSARAMQEIKIPIVGAALGRRTAL